MKRYHNKKSYIASEKYFYIFTILLLPWRCYNALLSSPFFPWKWTCKEEVEQHQALVERQQSNKFPFSCCFSKKKKYCREKMNKKVTRWILHFHVLLYITLENSPFFAGDGILIFYYLKWGQGSVLHKSQFIKGYCQKDKLVFVW